jgi:hypothetical protein
MQFPRKKCVVVDKGFVSLAKTQVYTEQSDAIRVWDRR